ncbi:MAG: HAMP domain-containing protein [Synechococcales cyanobacterium RM1_1_8]|nr:HAMP domain-containing protein [Synechococcales cyanobacterium RM1_1_8]
MSYKQAELAYMQGKYDQAAELIEPLIHSNPDDPKVRLLRGHIYCYGLQQYSRALADYEAVTSLTQDPSFIDYANQGAQACHEFGASSGAVAVQERPVEAEDGDWAEDFGEDGGGFLSFEEGEFANTSGRSGFGSSGPGSSGLGRSGAAAQAPGEDDFGFGDNFDFDPPLGQPEAAIANSPFDSPQNSLQNSPQPASETPDFPSDPSPSASFDLGDVFDEGLALDSDEFSAGNPFGMADDGARGPDNLFEDPLAEDDNLFSLSGEEQRWVADAADESAAFEAADELFDSSPGLEPELSGFEAPVFEAPVLSGQGNGQGLGNSRNASAPASAPGASASSRRGSAPEATLFVDSDNLDEFEGGDSGSFALSQGEGETLDMFSMDDAALEGEMVTFTGSGVDQGGADRGQQNHRPGGGDRTFGSEQAFDFEADLGAEGSRLIEDLDAEMAAVDFAVADLPSPELGGSELSGGDSTGGDTGGRSDTDFLNEFDAFDDFGGLSDFDLAEDSIGFTSPAPSSGFDIPSGDFNGADDLSSFTVGTDDLGSGADSVWGEGNLPSFAPAEAAEIEPAVAVGQGMFAPLENASFGTKRTVLAGAAGLAAVLGVLGTSVALKAAVPEAEQRAKVAPIALALAGGIGGMVGSTLVGELIRRQVRRTTEDLQTQFSKVVQGNFNTQATIYSEDELGQLSAGFNNMSRVILATTKEAQRKAEEQEQQKEDLQRQVIRLLDDVEGAARGDLTVQAEVTADVLGAVADSFNLTIQNLREIVLQVKTAATQVNKASSENETFARSLSSDALRQAEELAVTLNSVQIMTDSIQRVADSAREAEEVARTASATALRGGEAVEKTVAGILQIRETVAETTRKVKRLAESSQEISKIVALISAIASRTNLLALNASIEAARAGDAGRGFAIVADEVRQLADRAAKSSKEIEQIVLQIQGETGSVMVAMEEGNQQVSTGMKLAEQAKRSLDDIIQVSNRIDQLVRSITADTVEQTETSRQVAQVMQSVELTAQETSQEAQRVSRSLQNLVGVASDLQTSVERFRVEESEAM